MQAGLASAGLNFMALHTARVESFTFPLLLVFLLKSWTDAYIVLFHELQRSLHLGKFVICVNEDLSLKYEVCGNTTHLLS